MVLQGQWVKAPSDFKRQGVPVRRLMDEDRAKVRDSRLWRTLAPDPQFDANRDAACGGPAANHMRALAVSQDGEWARAEFESVDQAETCLARRDGGRWRERECDITMIADPVQAQAARAIQTVASPQSASQARCSTRSKPLDSRSARYSSGARLAW